MKTTANTKGLKDHYHWVIAGVLLFMLFTHGGAANNLNSLHLVPVSEHLGITRAEFSLAMSCRTLLSVVSTFVSGFLIQRFGTRISVSIGLITTAGSYLMLTQLESVWMLALGGALMGAANGFCSTAAAAQVVRIWFHRYEGTVLGLVTAASGIGGSVMCLIQTAAMEMTSFRGSFMVCAVANMLAAALMFLLVRNNPRDMGLKPLGHGEKKMGEPTDNDDHFPGLPMKELCRRPAFYLMIVCTLLTAFSMYMAFSVIRPYLIDCGFSTAQASGLQSAMLLMLTGSKFLVGLLSDKLGPRRITLLCTAFAVAGLAMLAVTKTYPMAVISVVIYTVALPLVTITAPLVASSLFGTRAHSQYVGILVAMCSASNFLADYITNLLHGIFGSYRPSFWISAGISLLAIVLFLILYRIADRDRDRFFNH